jgi:hypothetical protein
MMDREWTDKRVDDFADRDDRFEANVGKRFDKVDERFDKLEAKFDATNRTLWAGIVILVLSKFFFG